MEILDGTQVMPIFRLKSSKVRKLHYVGNGT